MEINSLSNRKKMYYQEALLQKSLRLPYILSHVYKAVIYCFSSTGWSHEIRYISQLSRTLFKLILTLNQATNIQFEPLLKLNKLAAL